MRTEHLAEEVLAAWALDELREEDREPAARHLADCAECRRAANEMEQALVAVREAGLPEAPGELLAGLLATQARLEARPSTRRRRTPARVALAAAALVLLFLGGFWAGRRSAESPAAAADRPADLVPASATDGRDEVVRPALPDPPRIQFATTSPART
jgi:anti-sigma factor RsiW